ncbi:uncharacterized protein LOC103316364 isoform X2 [Nasonia vitripennis]|uniref:Uncharacterized protein n=1 Tax=Nasonia vitripennis TaxID=7425 RepID=A0A7M7QNL4_NASVI|nr:uncharacterized protein LOC103316364 isoform X2 [Nasonia vitripennis]
MATGYALPARHGVASAGRYFEADSGGTPLVEVGLGCSVCLRWRRRCPARGATYLGEKSTVGQKSWRIIKYKRRSGFLRDLATVFMDEENLSFERFRFMEIEELNIWNTTHPIIFSKKIKSVSKFVQRLLG